MPPFFPKTLTFLKGMRVLCTMPTLISSISVGSDHALGNSCTRFMLQSTVSTLHSSTQPVQGPLEEYRRACMQLFTHLSWHSFTSLTTLALSETSNDCGTALRAYARRAMSVTPLVSVTGVMVLSEIVQTHTTAEVSEFF